MTNPAEILDALIAALQKIPDLVDEMGCDATRIRAYHDAYPTLTSWELAVQKAPTPSITGVWMESCPGSMGGGLLTWEHRYSLMLRARRVPDGKTPQQVGFYRAFELIVNGVPTGADLAMVNYQFHPACYPIDLPSMSRKVDTEGVDFFEVLIGIKELQA